MTKDKKKKSTKKVVKTTKRKEPVKGVVKTNREKELVRDNHKEKFRRGIEKIDENRRVIYALVGGILLGVLVNMLFWPERIATLENGAQPVATIDGLTITADDLYTDMKESYSVGMLLDEIDTHILTEMYPSDSEMEKYIDETATYYYNYYKSQNGYTKEAFLKNNGFNTEDKFLDYLRLDYRRKKYYEEYTRSLVTDTEIQAYYDDEVFGDIDSKHILVEINDEDGLKDAEAKALAEEIINKLNGGATFDQVKEEYKDSITYEELGYQSFDASLETAYMEAMKSLGNGKYTTTPVKTSYGYHIVYRIDQKDKPVLKDVKDAVVEVLAKEKASADTNLYYKSLINMRNDVNLTFSDTNMKEKYNTYISTYGK